jgi:hypothetical protein
VFVNPKECLSSDWEIDYCIQNTNELDMQSCDTGSTSQCDKNYPNECKEFNSEFPGTKSSYLKKVYDFAINPKKTVSTETGLSANVIDFQICAQRFGCECDDRGLPWGHCVTGSLWKTWVLFAYDYSELECITYVTPPAPEEPDPLP